MDFKIPKTLIPSEEDLTRKNFRDDWGLKQSSNDKYLDNTFWKVPDTYSIDELLEEQKKEVKPKGEGSLEAQQDQEEEEEHKEAAAVEEHEQQVPET